MAHSLSTLNYDLHCLIVFDYLDEPSRASLALTSKEFWSLIVRTRDDAISLYSTNFLLQCVKHGYGFLLAWGLRHLSYQSPDRVPLVKAAMAHIENQNLRTMEALLEVACMSDYEDFLEIYSTIISRLPQTPEVFNKVWSLNTWKSLTINSDSSKCPWVFALHDSLLRKGCVRFVQMAMEEQLSENEIMRKGLKYWFPQARKSFLLSLMLVVESDKIESVMDLYNWHFGDSEANETRDSVMFESLYGILGRLHACPSLLKWCHDYYFNVKSKPSLNSLFDTNDAVNRGFLIDGSMNVKTNSVAAKLLFSDPTFFQTHQMRVKVAVLRSLLNSAIRKLDCEMFSTFATLAKEILDLDKYHLLLRKRFIENDFISYGKFLLPLPLSTNDKELREKFSRFILHVLESTPNFNDTILRLVDDTTDVVNVELLVLFGNRALLERLLVTEKIKFDPDVLLNVFLRYVHIYTDCLNVHPDYLLNFENLEFLYKNGFRIRDPSLLEIAMTSTHFMDYFILSSLSRPQFIREVEILMDIFGGSWFKSFLSDDFDRKFCNALVTFYHSNFRGVFLDCLLQNAEYFWFLLGLEIHDRQMFPCTYYPDSDEDDPLQNFFMKICPSGNGYLW